MEAFVSIMHCKDKVICKYMFKSSFTMMFDKMKLDQNLNTFYLLVFLQIVLFSVTFNQFQSLFEQIQASIVKVRVDSEAAKRNIFSIFTDTFCCSCFVLQPLYSTGNISYETNITPLVSLRRLLIQNAVSNFSW